jgi:hypothetical protein
MISGSVVDPDPVRSKTFCRIRIRKKSFRIRAAGIRDEFEKNCFKIQNFSKNEQLKEIFKKFTTKL